MSVCVCMCFCMGGWTKETVVCKLQSAFLCYLLTHFVKTRFFFFWVIQTWDSPFTMLPKPENQGTRKCVHTLDCCWFFFFFFLLMLLVLFLRILYSQTLYKWSMCYVFLDMNKGTCLILWQFTHYCFAAVSVECCARFYSIKMCCHLLRAHLLWRFFLQTTAGRLSFSQD